MAYESGTGLRFYNFSPHPSMTTEQREALEWALDLAYEDQSHYLSCGSPEKDYGEGWPEIAKERAQWCEAIAELAECEGTEEQWRRLAGEYRESAGAEAAEADEGTEQEGEPLL